jgi:hypothetical protein
MLRRECKFNSPSQRRQSCELFLESSEMGLPHPLTRSRMCLSSLVPGGAHSLGGGELGGANSDEGTDTLGIPLYSVLYTINMTFLHTPTTLQSKKYKDGLSYTFCNFLRLNEAAHLLIDKYYYRDHRVFSCPIPS